jgi:hypothetical protein
MRAGKEDDSEFERREKNARSGGMIRRAGLRAGDLASACTFRKKGMRSAPMRDAQPRRDPSRGPWQVASPIAG